MYSNFSYEWSGVEWITFEIGSPLGRKTVKIWYQFLIEEKKYILFNVWIFHIHTLGDMFTFIQVRIYMLRNNVSLCSINFMK